MCTDVIAGIVIAEAGKRAGALTLQVVESVQEPEKWHMC